MESNKGNCLEITYTHQQLVEWKLEECHLGGKWQQSCNEAQRIGPRIALILICRGLAAGICIAVHHLCVDGPKFATRIIRAVINTNTHTHNINSQPNKIWFVLQVKSFLNQNLHLGKIFYQRERERERGREGERE